MTGITHGYEAKVYECVIENNMMKDYNGYECKTKGAMDIWQKGAFPWAVWAAWAEAA